MPQYQLTSPDGRSVIVTGESAPSEQEAESIFQSMGVSDKVQRQPKKTEASGYAKQTFEQFKNQAKIDSEKSLGEQSLEFGAGVGRGILQMARMGANAVGETFTAAQEGEWGKIAKSLPEGVAKAVFDIGEMGEAIGGRIGDQFVGDEEALQRQFARFQQDQLDAQKRQRGFVYTPEETLHNLTETAAIFGDPTNLIGLGVAGKLGKVSKLGAVAEKTGAILDVPSRVVRSGLKGGVKLGAKGAEIGFKASRIPLKILSGAGKGTEFIAGIPRRTVAAVISKSLGVAGGSRSLGGLTKLGGIATGPTGASLIAAEALGGVAAKSSKLGLQAEKVLHILGDRSRQARFIDEVLLDPTISKSVKKGVKLAGLGGGRALDLAFNSIANGVTTATLQGILTKMATDDPGMIGEAVGAGGLFGAAIPVGPVQSRLTPEQLNGVARKRIENWAEKQQVENLGNMSAQDKTMITALASGVNNMDIRLMDADSFNMFYESEKGGVNKDNTATIIDDDGVIWVNSDHKNSSPEIIKTMTDRVGEDYLDANPDAMDSVVNSFLDDDGIALTHANGDEVKVGGDFGREIEHYNSQQPDGAQITTTQQAVQKYLEIQTTSLFNRNNPKFIKTLPVEMQQVLRDVSHSALGKIGLVDSSGNGYVGKDVPVALKGMAKNNEIKQGIKNLDNLNKSLQGEQVLTLKQQAAEANRTLKAKERAAQLKQRKAEKDQRAKDDIKRKDDIAKANISRKQMIFDNAEKIRNETAQGKIDRLDKVTANKIANKFKIEEDNQSRANRKFIEDQELRLKKDRIKQDIAKAKEEKKATKKLEKELEQAEAEQAFNDELHRLIDEVNQDIAIQKVKNEELRIQEENRAKEKARAEDEVHRLQAEADLDQLQGDLESIRRRIIEEQRSVPNKDTGRKERDKVRFQTAAKQNKGINKARIVKMPNGNWQSVDGRQLGKVEGAVIDAHANDHAYKLQESVDDLTPVRIDAVTTGAEKGAEIAPISSTYYVFNFNVPAGKNTKTRVTTHLIDTNVMAAMHGASLADVKQAMIQVDAFYKKGGNAESILKSVDFENNIVVKAMRDDDSLNITEPRKELGTEKSREADIRTRSGSEVFKAIDFHNMVNVIPLPDPF